MTRHLNLLASAPKPAPPAQGLPAWAAPAVLGLALLCAAATGHWTQRPTAALAQQLQAVKQAARADSDSGEPRLDATVLAALRIQVVEREAQATALGSDNTAAHEPASAWLAALDASGASGVAINQVRIEAGPRLTLAGSALQPSDVHGFLARLQKHPLTGRAAIGQLDIRRGDPADAPLNFRLAPPTPESAAAPAPSEGRGLLR